MHYMYVHVRITAGTCTCVCYTPCVVINASALHGACPIRAIKASYGQTKAMVEAL